MREENPKILLGLSGGSDSLALYNILLSVKANFSACYVDHNFRSESKNEGRCLEKLCYGDDVPFFYRELTSLEGKNLENRYRKMRYGAFKEIYHENDFKILMLGHHKDDQIETILKRFFEGGGLYSMGGMRVDDILFGMRVLRPLLFHFKKDFKELSQDALEDITNQDSRFLRARMRRELLPFVEKSFGKKIGNNLLLFGNRMLQVDRYLENQSERFFTDVQFSRLGAYWLLPSDIDSLEMEYVIDRIGRKLNVILYRGEMSAIIKIIDSRKSRKHIVSGSWKISYDRGYLFFLNTHCTISFESSKIDDHDRSFSWKSLWKESPSVGISKSIVLGKLDLNKKLPNGSSLRKWFYKHRVPISMAEMLPILLDSDGNLLGELSSGNWENHMDYEDQLLTFKVRINKL